LLTKEVLVEAIWWEKMVVTKMESTGCYSDWMYATVIGAIINSWEFLLRIQKEELYAQDGVLTSCRWLWNKREKSSHSPRSNFFLATLYGLCTSTSLSLRLSWDFENVQVPHLLAFLERGLNSSSNKAPPKSEF
jgi:hypothetical protein